MITDRFQPFRPCIASVETEEDSSSFSMDTPTLTSPPRPAGERATLTAFCASRPAPEEVEGVLKVLGFRLVFFLPADEANASMSDFLPPLPAQYHFEDEVGTCVVYLAGVDALCLADDEDDPKERTPHRYPPHASRFWLIPGGRDLVARRVRGPLAVTWALRWQELSEEEHIEEAA